MPATVSECVLAGNDRAPRAAREFVGKALSGHPRLEDLIQIVSELTTNAVRHSRSRRPGGRVNVSVVAGIGYGGVRFAGVTVTDDGSDRQPCVQRCPRVEESGYGLALVEELADRWGHYILDQRRTVWATVTTP
ncbi:ATP-binding protein [Thermocatellispora tengchongensis]